MMGESRKGNDGERNQEEIGLLDSTSWWSTELFSSCSAKEKLCISIGLCCLSAVLWVIACFLLLCKRCRAKEKNLGDSAASALYCFLGNLSGTVGAFLSNQLAIQVFMGVLLSTLDVLRLISIPCSGRAERRIKMMRKRRRQNIFTLSLPLVFGAGIFACHGLHHQRADSAPFRRRLLSLDLQDNIEFLGYALGLLSFVIGWTSRFPSFSKARLEKMTSAVHMSFRTLCVLANALYGAAILAYDSHPESALRALPWLLACFSCAAFDVIILGLSGFRRLRGQANPQSWDPTDRQYLLDGNTQDPPGPKDPDLKSTLQRLRSKKGLKKAAEIGRYMDINIHPVQPVPKAPGLDQKGLLLGDETIREQSSVPITALEHRAYRTRGEDRPLLVFLKEVKLSREGPFSGIPLGRTGTEVNEEDLCSSDSSSASSSLNPELEWDFEEANANWNKVHKPLKRKEAFALRDWKVHFGMAVPQAKLTPILSKESET